MLVHQLVLLAFVGKCPAGLMTIHLNHKPSDNRLANLEYGTRSKNIRMDFEIGSRCHAGERAPNAKLTSDQVLEIRAVSLTTYELAEKYGVTERNIRTVLSRKTWTHI